MDVKVVLFGATGMVGEGVLLECLSDTTVTQVLVISRRTSGVTHPKLREIVRADLFDLGPIEEELRGYNACFFCLGVSSIRMSRDQYRRITYDLTLNIARTLAKVNPDMTFCYVTGAGTDSSERGRVTWARVKGATENALLQLFQNSYMFRPGFMKASPGQRRIKQYYTLFAWLYPIGRRFYPAAFCTLQEVGRAMIKTVTMGYSKRVLEVKDIVRLSGTPDAGSANARRQ